MLEIRPLCVCEITAVLQLAISTVSKHLSILRDAGFISDKKDGKWVNYHLTDPIQDKHIHALLLSLLPRLDSDEAVQEDAEKVKSVDRYEICDL